MGLEFITRVQRTSVVAAGLLILALAASAQYGRALGFAAGVAWSLANLALLQFVVTRVITPNRDPQRAFTAITTGIGGTLALFVAGGFALTRVPAIALAAGFTLPLAVIALKGGSRWLLGSPQWTAITRSRWTGVVVLALLVGGVWMLARTNALAQEHAATPTEHAAPATEHAAPDAHGAPAEGHAEADGPKMFPNVIGLIAEANHEQPWAKALHRFEFVIFAMFAALLISVVTIAGTRNPKMIPGPLQNLVESVVENAYNFFVGILGPKYGPRFVPFLGTLFLYIWVMNAIGTIPFMHSPTANLNITVAMALTVFIYVQFTAFRELGLMGWLDHMAGQPRNAIGWAMVPLMLPVHLLGEIAKPISLSCRLFGNIFGEDMLLVAFATLGVTVLSGLHVPFGLPLQLPFMFLGVLITQPVQALVFTMLSTVYFLLMLPHDHAHGHAEEAHHAANAHPAH